MPRSRSRLFKRPRSPFWYAVYSSPEGVPIRQSTGCRDRGAAETWLTARELERTRSQLGVPVARPTSLLEATSEYLAEREVDMAEKWWGTVEGFVRLQVLPYFGDHREVGKIEAGEIARFRVAQMNRPQIRYKSGCCRARWTLSSALAWVCSECALPFKEGPKVSPSTVNRLFWALAAFGKWCVERKYHTANPWSLESLPESDTPPPTVEDAQLEQIFAALEAREQTVFPWRELFEFAHETALRRGELERLHRADVSEAERRAWVVSSHARGLTKGRKTRPVALSARALEILRALPAREDGLVFGPVPDARRAFRAAAKAAGLERVWLHLFRHLSATKMGKAGAGNADLLAWGGWSSLRMVQRYTHSDHRRQIDLVDRAFAPTPRPRHAPEGEAGDPVTGTARRSS